MSNNDKRMMNIQSIKMTDVNQLNGVASNPKFRCKTGVKRARNQVIN